MPKNMKVRLSKGAAAQDDKPVIGAVKPGGEPSAKPASQPAAAAEEDEYEYVTFSELTRPFREWVAYWADELRLPLMVVAAIVVLLIVSLVSQVTNTLIIIIIAALITLLMSVLIVLAWQSRKEAVELYNRAEKVYSQKVEIERRGSLSDSDGQGKGADGEKDEPSGK